MSAAGFVLAINIFVAGLFTAAFGIVVWRNKAATGARWLSFAYALGVLNAVLELVLPGQADPRLLGIVVFSVALGAFMVCVIGLARHYGVKVPWTAIGGLFTLSVAANGLLIDQPATSTFERALVYQLPYFAAHVLGAFVVFRSRRRAPLDLLLIGFLLVSGLQFVAKPFMAIGMGDGGSANYLHSLYGAYSQLLIAFLLISNGVLMLLIIVRDEMAALTTRSDTDKLSGLWNRRGFEDRAERAMVSVRRTGNSGALVLADLDHFKRINDTLGHEYGDTVIAVFAQILADSASPAVVIGRQGGEEFAAFIPGANLATGRLYADSVRANFAERGASLGIAELSASFGVVQLRAEDSLADLLRRADLALYEAKKNGRNRVSVAGHIEAAIPLDRREELKA